MQEQTQRNYTNGQKDEKTQEMVKKEVTKNDYLHQSLRAYQE